MTLTLVELVHGLRDALPTEAVEVFWQISIREFSSLKNAAPFQCARLAALWKLPLLVFLLPTAFLLRLLLLLFVSPLASIGMEAVQPRF